MTAMDRRISYNLSGKNQLSKILSTHLKIFHTNLTFLPRQTFSLWKAERVFKEPFSHHVVIMIDLHIMQDTVPLTFVVSIVTGRKWEAEQTSQPADLSVYLPVRLGKLILLVVPKWTKSRTKRVIQFLCMALVWALKHMYMKPFPSNSISWYNKV